MRCVSRDGTLVRLTDGVVFVVIIVVVVSYTLLGEVERGCEVGSAFCA